MGTMVLGFALVQMLVVVLAHGGGAWRLRGAMTAFGDFAGASEAQCYGQLGAPACLRQAEASEDAFDVMPDIIADWAESGPHGGWHVALAFQSERCLGVAQCNFQFPGDE